VIGIRDPAARVRGRGVRKLRAAGVDVVEGVLAERCREVHEHYLHHVRTGLPFVTLKTAASLDGRIAVRTGDSKWVTGVPARRLGHRLRAQHHAIAVGVGTVLADDPRLDVRLVRGVDPIRVVFDTRLRVAESRPLLLGPGTIVVHGDRAPARARRVLEGLGAELVEIPGRPDVEAVLKALGDRSIRSLLVEGGGRLIGSFVEARAWNRWHWFLAPRVLGEGTAAVAGVGYDAVADAPRVRVTATRRLGDDTLITLEP
jgi:diaminohydroxyphosphoribosylaminopyrimidine deaminase/5-amino-6-(5-phosphoribosylamino)uracil reductase